jgi:branched-chain amino acid aminotransferase
MKANCSINGKSKEKSNALISVFDNSLFYADGLFETLLAVGNRVVFLDDHLNRLEKGASLIGLKIPTSRKKLATWIYSAVRKNSAAIKKIRVTVTGGDSAFWSGKPTKPRIIIIVTEFKLPETTCRLMISPYRVDNKSPFRNVKTLSFIIEMTSRKMAYSKGLDDAILINRSGYVAETTSANIFWIKNGRLYTPPLSAGCLDGMIRKHIFDIGRQKHIHTYEKNIKLVDLLNSDEIFITSSLKLILPVVSIHADKTFRFHSDRLTIELRHLLQKDILGK